MGRLSMLSALIALGATPFFATTGGADASAGSAAGDDSVVAARSMPATALHLAAELGDAEGARAVVAAVVGLAPGAMLGAGPDGVPSAAGGARAGAKEGTPTGALLDGEAIAAMLVRATDSRGRTARDVAFEGGAACGDVERVLGEAESRYALL